MVDCPDATGQTVTGPGSKPPRRTATLATGAAMLLLAGAVAAAMFGLGRGEVYGALRRELMALARTGAAFIDPAPALALRPGDEGTPAYRAVRARLDRVLAATPEIRYVYLLQPTADSHQFRFLVDTDRELPAAIGELLDARDYPELLAAMAAPAADEAITVDRWGRWLSGYAPIRDELGRTVLILGLDLPAGVVQRSLLAVGLIAGAFGVLAATSALVVVRWLAGRMSRDVRELAVGVQSLSQRVADHRVGDDEPPTGDPAELLRYYERLIQRLEASQAQLSSLFDQTLTALATAVETRDPYTALHAQGVARLADGIARRLGLAGPERTHLRYAAVLHDIGKIGVPDRILLKPGPLTPEEWVRMREHPRLGYNLLRQVEALHPVADIVLAHHERWDGRGYPAGLAGRDILLSARIISVVDAFNAITSDRPYRARQSLVAAVAEIQRHAGSQFDPAVVVALVNTLQAEGMVTDTGALLLRRDAR